MTKCIFNENGELIKSDSQTAEVLNTFLSNMGKILKVPVHENPNSNIENVKDPVFRAILKLKKTTQVSLQ